MVAKKRDTQQRMEGTYDKPVQVVEDKATAYADTLSVRMRKQEEENTLRDELIDLMVEHNVTKCELDGRVVELVTSPEKRKIKVRTEGDGKGEGGGE